MAGISSNDYERILDFPYMKSEDDLAEFTDFVMSLKVKKVEGKFSQEIYTI